MMVIQTKSKYGSIQVNGSLSTDPGPEMSALLRSIKEFKLSGHSQDLLTESEAPELELCHLRIKKPFT